jgi:hypothetical protein
MLSNNIMDYYFVAQGKTSIPGVDDGEELTLTDVRYPSTSWFASNFAFSNLVPYLIKRILKIQSLTTNFP